MAHGTCRPLELLIKGQPRDLSLITGAAEDWGKVIKGAPAPAVPWQETDQTNLCSFSCKINVQFKILLLTRQASPKWQCTIFLASVFSILLFLCHYHFSFCTVLSSLSWHLSPSNSRCYLCLWLSFFLVIHLPSSLCNAPQSFSCGHWPLYWIGSHPLERWVH